MVRRGNQRKGQFTNSPSNKKSSSFRSSGSSRRHGGGAWKVAYADFITAMMALFMLLWLLNSTPSQKLKMIAEYFKPSVGLYNNSEDERKDKSGGKDENRDSSKFGDEVDLDQAERDSEFERLESDIKQSLGADNNQALNEESISFARNIEGLSIYLSDSGKSTIFEKGGAKLTPFAVEMLKNIAQKIQYTNMFVAIEGYSGKSIDLSVDGYGKWELSLDRANTARKFFINQGISPEIFYRLSGYGDNQPVSDNDDFMNNQKRLCIILIKRNSVNSQKNVSAPLDNL